MTLKGTYLNHLASSFFDVFAKENCILHHQAFSMLYVIIYFLQTLAPLFKSQFQIMENTNMAFFAKVVVYSNFTNLLTVVRNTPLFLFCYITSIIYAFVPFLIIFINWGIRLHFAHRFDENLRLILNILRNLLYTYEFIFLMPSLQILIASFDCQINQNSEYYLCDNSPFSNKIHMFFTIPGITLGFALGLILLLTNRNYNFGFKALNLEPNIPNLLAYFFRTSLIILQPILNGSQLVFYILSYLFGLLLIWNALFHDSLRKESLNKLFIGLLFGFEGTIFILMYIVYGELIMTDGNLVYLVLILVAILMKLGFKLTDSRYTDKLMIKSNEFRNFDEFLVILRTELSSPSSNLFYQGFFSNHIHRKCKQAACLAQKDYFIFNKISTAQTDRELGLKNLDRFIKNKLNQFINDKTLKSVEERKYQLVLKYIDFLISSNGSSLFLLFEFERVKTKLKKKPLYVRFLLKWLSEKIRNKIKTEESRLEMLNENYTDLRSYFNFDKKKRKFENLTKNLLHEKRKFWSNYINGFKRMSALTVALRDLCEIINEFEKKLKAYQRKITSQVLVSKLYSIFYCLFYNDLDKALKYESDFESYFNHERSKIEKSMSKISFLHKEIVTCEASFLNMEGVIKSFSKTEKLAHLFGYSKNEILNISTVEQLMPSFLRKNHSKFVENYLLNPKINSESTQSKSIQSFGLHKNQTIFPLTIDYAISYAYDDDFVLVGAISPEKNEQIGILFLENGEILGITFQMKNFLDTTTSDAFLSENITHLKVHDLFFELSNILAANTGQPILRNQKAFFSIPLLTNFDSKSLTLTSNKRSKAFSKLQTHAYKSFESAFDVSTVTYDLSKTQNIKLHYLNVRSISKNSKITNMDNNKTLIIHKSFKVIEEIDEDMKDSDGENENVPPTYPDEKISKLEEKCRNIVTNLRSFGPDGQEASEEKVSFPEKSEMFSSMEQEESKINPKQVNYNQILRLQVPKGREKAKLNDEAKFKEEKTKTYEDSGLKETKQKEISSENLQSAFELSSNFNEIINSMNDEKIENPQNSDSSKIETVNLDVFSKHSSQLKLKSKNFKVFKSISHIQAYVPKNFYFFFGGIFCELLLILIYAIVLQVSETNYFELKYNPTKIGMINFCRLYSAFSFSTAITIEIEYSYLNMSEPKLDFNETEIYKRIISRSFFASKEIVYSERNSPHVLNYQSIYRNYKTKLINIDSNPKTIMEVSYFELLDFYLNYLQEFEQRDSQRENYEYLILMQRNFPYFLLPSAAIFTEIQNSFTSYNDEVSQNLLEIMLIFLALMTVLKLFEIMQLIFLHNYLLKILGIFLRTNARDVVKELLYLDHTIEELKDKNEDYFYSSFAYKSIERLQKFRDLEFAKDNSDGGNQLDKKAKKFKNNRNIKSLSQSSNFFFFVATMSLSFSFYFFNFYYWLVVNRDIKNLISINISFASIYVYSSSILTCNNNLLREKIIGNNDGYQDIKGASYQDSNSRIAYFNAALNKRFPIVWTVAQNELPTRIFQAEGYIKDPKFHQLTKSNICELLLEVGKIQSDEAELCANMWNGALQKGLLISINHYLEEMKQLGDLRNITNQTQKQLEEIKAYIHDPNHVELFLGDYFLNNGLYLFYQYINNYYDFIIENSIYTLKVLLVVTTIIFSLIYIGLWIYIWSYFKSFFKVLGTSLFLMPYEKVTEDEATFQIINSFLK